MRIVLWIANEANQKALANRIHAAIPVTAIVTESRQHKRKITFQKLIEKGVEKLFLRPIANAWYGMLAHYSNQYPAYPDVPLLDVENINSDAVVAFTEKHQPDLIIVSGTRLIKKKLLSLSPSIGILNLHTGLSPYIKGGPNCTNWCIATEQFHLIGNTIMWIDEGIDSGNIVATAFTPFTGNETLAEVHLKVMDHAHALYVNSIKGIAAGKRSNVAQSQIAEGVTYYNRQWGLKEKLQLIKNMKKFNLAVQQNKLEKQRAAIKIVDI